MSIHDEYGKEEPDIKPHYVGLFMLDGVIYARLACLYQGKELIEESGLNGKAKMVIFARDVANEPLALDTEIKPLIDLAFANIAYKLGPESMHREDGKPKNREEFLHEGLSCLEKSGLFAAGLHDQIRGLLDEHKNLWPQEILPLFRLFRDTQDNKPLLPRKAKP